MRPLPNMIKNIGQIHYIEKPWTEIFAWFPRRTITGRWVWMRKLYQRRVWRYTGFVSEPFTEYADIFDLLQADTLETDTP